MDVKAQHVRFLHWQKFDVGRLANGERVIMEQPYFHTLQNTSRIRLSNGQRLLLGVHKLTEPDEKSFELFLLQVRATKAEESK